MPTLTQSEAVIAQKLEDLRTTRNETHSGTIGPLEAHRQIDEFYDKAASRLEKKLARLRKARRSKIV